jgi:hypothetical protein
MKCPTPTWNDVWSAVGPLIGVVIGALLTPWMAWRWQRKQWSSDNKKEEYRNLLDALGECVQKIKGLKERVFISNRSSFDYSANTEEAERLRQSNESNLLNNQIIETLRGASKVLEDRLFIDAALRKHKVKERWARLEEMANRRGSFLPPAPNQPTFDSAAFSLAWQELANEIRHIAKQDIGGR